jgi:hypothetical protein
MAARTRRPAHTPDNPPVVDPELEPPPLATTQEEEKEEKEKIDFWEFFDKLDEPTKKVSKVYLYRLDPPVVKRAGVGSKRKAIDVFPGHLFSYEMLHAKHRGGTYQIYIDSKVSAACINRVVELPGPAMIYPEFILVDDQGNPLATQPPPPVAAPTESNSGNGSGSVVQVVEAVVAALKDKQDGNPNVLQQAIADAMMVGKQANLAAVDILASAAKNAAPSGSTNSMETLLRELLNEIRQKPEPDPVAKKVMDTALDRLVNPPAPPAAVPAANPLEGLKQLSELFGVEGGGIGLLKNALGQKQSSFWEEVGKDTFGMIGTAIRENMPGLIQWLRERTYVNHAQFMASRAAQGKPGAPAPSAAGIPVQPVPPNSDPPAAALGGDRATQPQGQPAPMPNNPTEEQIMEQIRQQITMMIANFWASNMSGQATGVAIKSAFAGILPMLRIQFNKLEPLIEMAKLDPILGPITVDEDFPAFAKEFFDELQKIGPLETGPPPASA